MAKKTKKSTNQDINLVQIPLNDLKVMDKIFITNEEDRVEYTVLDVGNPFILLEDPTHFAYLYRVVNPIYKDFTNN